MTESLTKTEGDGRRVTDKEKEEGENAFVVALFGMRNLQKAFGT